MNMMKKTLITAISATALLGFSQAQAQEAVDYPSSVKIREMTQDAPSALKNVLTNGEKVINKFDAGYNYEGYVIDANGQTVILYYEEDKNIAFSGVLLDENGINVSQQHYAQQIPKQNYADVYSNLVDSGNFFTEGAEGASAEIYVIFDPACPYCHSFYENSRELVESGELKIHWTPVAFLSKASLGKVAKMWQSEDPVAVFKKDSDNYRDGGIEPLSEDEIQEEVNQLTQENIQFMRAFESSGTPTIIYETPEGKVYTIGSSMPTDELRELVDSISVEEE